MNEIIINENNFTKNNIDIIINKLILEIEKFSNKKNKLKFKNKISIISIYIEKTKEEGYEKAYIKLREVEEEIIKKFKEERSSKRWVTMGLILISIMLPFTIFYAYNTWDLLEATWAFFVFILIWWIKLFKLFFKSK